MDGAAVNRLAYRDSRNADSQLTPTERTTTMLDNPFNANANFSDLLYAIGDGRGDAIGAGALMNIDAVRKQRLAALSAAFKAEAPNGVGDSHREATTTWDAAEALLDAQFIVGPPDGKDDAYNERLYRVFQMSIHAGKGRKFATPTDVAQRRIDDTDGAGG